MAANLWSDEQKSHQAIAKDKVAIQTMQKCSTTLRSKITEKSGVITDYWTNNLLDLILRKDNLNEAYKQVKRNKGKCGIDGMQVDELLPFLRENQETLIQEIREGRYKPNPVRRVEIPKETKGEFRKLGVPTVVDRVTQQAIAQELSPIYT